MNAQQRTGVVGRRRLAVFFGLALALANAGCGRLGFEKQTVVAAFPADRDEVRILLVYEGLNVLGDKENDLKDAKSRLRQLATEQTFYLMNAFSFSLKPDPARPLTEEEKKTWQLIQKHLSLLNGEFYLDEKGQLCFYQHLTIRDAQEFVKGCNEWIGRAIGKFAAEGLALDRAALNAEERAAWAMWDVETLQRLQAASKGKHAWLRLEAGRLSFTMPGTEHCFTHLKREGLRNCAKEPWLARLISDTPCSLDQRKDQLTVALGVGAGEPIRLLFEGDKDKRHFDGELRKYAQGLPVPFSKTATSKSLIDSLEQTKAQEK